MSSHDSQDPRAVALRRLVREARAESAPDLDWARIEEGVEQEARRAAPRPVSTSRAPLAWGAVALAAAAAVWLVSTRSPVTELPLSRSDLETSAQAARNGDNLAVGSRVETTGSELTVAHPERAQWTLAPSSSAILAGRDERITVHLERGSVLSHVVPNPKPETFVVEAAGARVAVHGTVFSVKLSDGHVVVDVQEGIVGVGPLGSPPAFFVNAASHAEFAADGRSGSIDGKPVGISAAASGDAVKPTAARGALVPAPGDAPSPAPAAELPEEPSINDIEAGVARIVDATSACFRERTPGNGSVQITVRTALSLDILDSGAVADVDFQPPLSPAAAACANAAIAQVQFAPSQHGGKVTRLLELKR
ncbi:MAG TPA: FecR family protein [Polyangiaceae bacterium]|nr:FecR family protein [Polyangiaceae bacterium]